MSFLKRRTLLITFLLMLILAVASALMLNTLLQETTVRSYIFKQISRETGYDVRAGQMVVRLRGRPGISVHEVMISSQSGIKSLSASKLRVHFSFAKLLRGNLDINKIFLLQPRLTLDIQQEDNGSKTVSIDAIEKTLAPIIERIPSISIEDGYIQFEGMPYSVNGLSLDVSKGTVFDSSLSLDMDCTLFSGDMNFPLTLRGKFMPGIGEKDESITLEFKIKDLPLSEISWLDKFQVKGRAKALITLSGTLNHLLAVKGIISADDFSIVHKKGTLSKTYAQPHLTFNFSSQYLDNKIDITNLSLSNGGLLLEGSSSVDLSESNKLKLDLRLKSPFMPLGTFKNIFPAPLLPGWVEGTLFPLLSGGKVRLKRLSLKGTIDEIQNLNQPENAGALSLEINLKDIAVFKNKKASFLSGVSASLRYDNASLQVFGLTAGLGKSLIKNGVLRIDNLYVDDPLFQYSAETAVDLDDIKKLTKNSRIPDAIRHPVQQCKQLAGMIEGRIKVDHKNKWKYPQIKKSEFSVRDVSVIHRKLILPLSVDKAKLKIDEAGKVSLNGTGLWGKSLIKNGVLRIDNLYVNDPLFQYSVEAAIDLDDIRQLSKNKLVPDTLRQMVQQCTQLDGRIEGRIKAEHKKTWDFPRIKKIELSVRDGSVTHNKLIFPLSVDEAEVKIDESGNVSLIGTGLWGESYFKADGNGKFDSKKKGGIKAKLNFATDFLDFFQIIAAQEEAGLSDEIPNLGNSTGKSFMALSDIQLHLEAESGKWNELHLGRIEADCAFRNGTFFLNQGIVKQKNGHLNFKGQVKTEGTFYSGEVDLKQYPVKRLYPESPLLEGDISLQGSFNMKGDTARELISELNGTFDLELSNGTFNQKSVFFKILNLFDIKRLMLRRNRTLLERGLYFNSILGQVDITCGIMSLNDFFMKCPLFNAVGEGTIDLNYETVDSVIGVEPLGRITSQIDKIPLSGYVLSDRVKSLMTYFFYITGPLSDPEVKNFSPTKLPKRIIQNSKRLLLSPVRLFKGEKKRKNNFLSEIAGFKIRGKTLGLHYDKMGFHVKPSPLRICKSRDLTWV